MTITTQKFTFEDYLSYADGSDIRYELVDGALIPMGLGTGKHGAIMEFLTDQFRDEIRRQQLPWTSKLMLVGVRSPRGRRWDTSSTTNRRSNFDRQPRRLGISRIKFRFAQSSSASDLEAVRGG
jgi:Uma2 family endonuclease